MLLQKQININMEDNGVRVSLKDNREISVEKFLTMETFLDTLHKNTKMESGLLPQGIRLYNRQGTSEEVLLEHPPGIKKVYWKDENEYTIPVPATLWYIKLQNVDDGYKILQNSHVYALKGPVLSLDTTYVYRFPFCNVDGYICWGDQQLPDWRSLLGLQSIPDIFFSAPFNGDLDGEKYTPFESQFGGNISLTKSLLNELDGKEEFPLKILIGKQTLTSALNYCYQS